MKALFAIFIVVGVFVVSSNAALAGEPGAVYPGTCEGLNGFSCQYEGISVGYILKISSSSVSQSATIEITPYYQMSYRGMGMMKLYPSVKFSQPGIKTNPGGGKLEYKYESGQIVIYDELSGLGLLTTAEVTVRVDNTVACKVKVREKAR